MKAGEGAAKLGEGGEGAVAKSLIFLGEGSGEGGEGAVAKLLKSLRRRLAKVAKHRTPQTPQRVYARACGARVREGSSVETRHG